MNLAWFTPLLQEELFGQEELEDAGLEDEEEEEGWGRPATAGAPRGDSRPAGRDEGAGGEADDQVCWGGAGLDIAVDGTGRSRRV